MIDRIKQYILRLGVVGLMFAPGLAPAVANAQIDDHLCGGATDLQIGGTPDSSDCEDDEGTAQDSVNSIINTVINIFSAIVGVVAVIMIVYGGFRYITSGGDSGKISSAQTTIIYAIVGLIVVALAQIIVRFVLSETITSGE